jgi:hypothetical protein
MARPFYLATAPRGGVCLWGSVEAVEPVIIRNGGALDSGKEGRAP